MAIYPPSPKFSDNEKRLLKLMAKLLLESTGADGLNSNIQPSEAVLTDAEAGELVSRIEALTTSPKFIKGCYLVEGLTQPHNAQEEKRLQEIYLSLRLQSGRSRAMGFVHWQNFKARVGLLKGYENKTSVLPMTFDYFMKMELKLLRAAGLDHAVTEQIMAIIEEQEGAIEGVRKDGRPLSHGVIRRIFDPILTRCKQANNILEDRHVSTHRIASAIIIVSDFGALFTTRDWGAAGFMSVIAGAIVETLHD